MRLFQDKKMYIYIFCAYAMIVLSLLPHTARRSAPTHEGAVLSIVIPQTIGMSLLALLASLAVCKTTNILEKWALILTAIICLLSVVSVFPKFGYSVPGLLIDHFAFLTVSCAATILVGWRMLQVVTDRRNEH